MDIRPQVPAHGYDQSSSTAAIDAPQTQPLSTQVTMAEFIEEGGEEGEHETGHGRAMTETRVENRVSNTFSTIDIAHWGTLE